MFKPFFIGTAIFVLSVAGVYGLMEYKDIDVRDHLPVSSIINQPLPESSPVELKENKEVQKTRIPVTLYYDFTCPYCKIFYDEAFQKFTETYSEQINIEILPYSLQSEGISADLHTFYSCIDQENEIDANSNAIMKFFIENITEETTQEDIIALFELDEEAVLEFDKCVEDKENIQEILDIRANAKERGVRGTPTLFIGDTKFEGNIPFRNLELEIMTQLK